jgi:antitoxin MazE
MTPAGTSCLTGIGTDILGISVSEFAVVTEIKKWGNSQGLRISRELLAQLQLAVGDRVDVTLRDGTIVITPARRVRGGHDLRDLVRRIPKGEKSREVEWGKSVGREVW